MASSKGSRRFVALACVCVVAGLCVPRRAEALSCAASYVSLIAPQQGVQAPRNAQIVVEAFSFGGGRIPQLTLRLQGGRAVPVQQSVFRSADITTITLKPRAPLSADASYEVVHKYGATDVEVSVLGRFTTGNAFDRDAPRLKSVRGVLLDYVSKNPWTSRQRVRTMQVSVDHQEKGQLLVLVRIGAARLLQRLWPNTNTVLVGPSAGPCPRTTFVLPAAHVRSLRAEVQLIDDAGNASATLPVVIDLTRPTRPQP